MSKHTPGPWKFVIHNRVEIVGPKDSSGWPMQVVYNCGMPDDATAIANARLIAAAPELLEALEYLADEYQYMPKAGAVYEKAMADAVYEHAMTVIRKARGET
jgi:hypothetical protein